MKLAVFPLSVALLCNLAACSGGGSARPEAVTSTIDWRDVATESDRYRLRQWRAAWVQGLAKAEAAGHDDAIAAEGALLQPDAAIDWQQPPFGNYKCRTIKIGGQSEGLLDYVAYPWFDCRLRYEEGLIGFAKLTGSQRPLGNILPGNSRRMVFLGTLQLGDEKGALQYGRDRERDMAGIVERIDEQRWRIVFPYPHFESTVDVVELIPVAAHETQGN